MIVDTVLKKIFGSKYDRDLKAAQPLVQQISDLEPSFSKLSDSDLVGKTSEYKQRLANGETLDDLLPEAFAVVREAGKRVLKMRHFDVQLIGGRVLHQGKISEMKTGEGKTLVATLPWATPVAPISTRSRPNQNSSASPQPASKKATSTTSSSQKKRQTIG